MKADEELVKRDLQRLFRLEYSFYEGSKKLSVKSFTPFGMILKEGDFGNGFNYKVTGDCSVSVADEFIPGNFQEYHADYELIIKAEDDVVAAIKDKRINTSKR